MVEMQHADGARGHCLGYLLRQGESLGLRNVLEDMVRVHQVERSFDGTAEAHACGQPGGGHVPVRFRQHRLGDIHRDDAAAASREGNRDAADAAAEVKRAGRPAPASRQPDRTRPSK